MPRGLDLYREALLDRGARGELRVERHGGETVPTSLPWWLRRPGTAEPADLAGLSLVDAGPVLDVGCATGRHLELLSRRGLRAVGIDTQAPAVALARGHGQRALVADFWRYRPAGAFRWVLLLGNNLGLAGTLQRLPALLRRCRGLLTPDGSVLASSVDPDAAGLPAAAGAYPGELLLRHRYGGRSGPWFPWLYVDPATLAEHAAAAGFRTAVLAGDGGAYTAVLSVAAAAAAARMGRAA